MVRRRESRDLSPTGNQFSIDDLARRIRTKGVRWKKVGTYSFGKLSYGYRNLFWLSVVDGLVQSHLLLDHLSESERGKFVLIVVENYVSSERLQQSHTISNPLRFEARRGETLTRSKVFLILIFCALIKLPTVTLIARLISLDKTMSRRCIFALASDIRIVLSKCRRVTGKEPVARDSLRRCAYNSMSFAESVSWSLGCTRSRAYMMYLRRSC